MEINALKKRDGIDSDKKLIDLHVQFEKLLSELRKRELPDEVVQSINTNIDLIDPTLGSEKEYLKQLRKTQADILSLTEKKTETGTQESLSQYLDGPGDSCIRSTPWCCLRSRPRQHGIHRHRTAHRNPHWPGNRDGTG